MPSVNVNVSEREKMTVADLFRAIKRHWILEIILFVVTVGAVAGFTFTATPMYSAQIQLMPKATASADASTAQSSSQRRRRSGSVGELY